MIWLWILLPPLSAAGFSCLPLSKKWTTWAAAASCLLILGFTLALAWKASEITYRLNEEQFLSHWVSADALSVLILVLIAIVSTTSAFFSIGYMKHAKLDSRTFRLYYANYNLFIFSMLAIPLMADPSLTWIAVELTTLCSALLVSIENSKEALEAAWKYVLLSLMGAGLALFGFLVLFASLEGIEGGEYTWQGLAAAAGSMPRAPLMVAFFMILIGLGAKVGLVPMHTWLPDAHSQAPSPVCALLSGIETTAILYVILRLFPILDAVPNSHAEIWAIVLGLLSTGTAAFLLIQVKDYKRLFAFSTVEHMGIILTAVGLGASAACYSAMLQIVSHSLTKSLCFLSAGSVLLTAGTRRISKVKGLWTKSPAAGTALVLGGLGITGAPPLAVFLSEFSIFKSGIAQKQYIATGLLALFIIIAFFGIMSHINRMVFANDPSDLKRMKADAKTRLPLSCNLSLIAAAIPVLILGMYIPLPLHKLLKQAADSLTLHKQWETKVHHDGTSENHR